MVPLSTKRARLKAGPTSVALNGGPRRALTSARPPAATEARRKSIAGRTECPLRNLSRRLPTNQKFLKSSLVCVNPGVCNMAITLAGDCRLPWQNNSAVLGPTRPCEPCQAGP